MAQNNLAQARALATEGFLRWIVDHDIEHGSHPVEYYIDDPDFVPVEPAWLREKISAQLPKRLRAFWGASYDEWHGEGKTA